jgi:hypothetical protein
MAAAGYSQTPLAKKLGIKEGFRARFIGQPAHYFDLFTDMPAIIANDTCSRDKKNFIHFFTKERTELESMLPKLRREIEENGVIWVSWPKKSAKIPCDVDENLVRNTGLACGLVDVKVCAVDEVWSALKFVIPLASRK